MPAVAWSLLAVVVLVLANGFFVAAEFALVTIRRTRVEELEAEGVAAAKHVAKALRDLDRYIAGTQVGITVASIALGWVGEPALVRLLTPVFGRIAPQVSEGAIHNVALGLAFTVITFLHVIVGELLPKSLALQKPEATSLAVARPLALVLVVFQPLIWSLNGLGNTLLRWLGLQASGGHEAVHSSTELELLIRQSHEAGHLDDFEKRMLQKTFRFSETTVAEIMVPRAEVQGLDVDSTPAEILALAAEASYSRLPVYQESLDDVVGVVYVHDVFRAVHRGEPVDLRTVLRPALFVPESFRLDGMIAQFREKQTQIAVVVDEHGGTAGILTLEDVVETVFGEIQDQNEDATPTVTQAEDGTLLVRGDARLDELNEALGWDLRDAISDTIAGYIMRAIGAIAHEGATVATPHGTLRVAAMDRHRIVQVVVTPVADAEADEAQGSA